MKDTISFYFALTIAVIRYIPRVLIVWAGKIFTWCLCWLIAFFCYREEETRVTGYPSQFPGKLREHIDSPFELASTPDDCGDAHWWSGRTRQFTIFGWAPFANVTNDEYEASRFIRYCARVLWLARNPAYTLARDLGFRQTGMDTENGTDIVRHRDQEHLWDSGFPNLSFWTARNAKGQMAFLVMWQFYFYRQRCLEVVLGYKIPWHGDAKNKAMVVGRISPFKKYEI